MSMNAVLLFLSERGSSCAVHLSPFPYCWAVCEHPLALSLCILSVDHYGCRAPCSVCVYVCLSVCLCVEEEMFAGTLVVVGSSLVPHPCLCVCG